ncbi:major facilitator superfamily transporter [Colletotrichum graminicola]|uniref:Major facilitator superfamily transporter n=1 Tax=Colletotrichum graminicola (strain M1.001 / M2 / FGSC 10212) TaxID=645133 RepID=E3QZI8_COLGM|nr:major facilitator superfamily transporter [Colletotrichum graminicola M1.001]EFQ36276.1 major facilitator superfamily transporter [Colletotrichum graminicola M1.001]WDK23708.1 major facilitator superfamily transporter [Colletotrichum graminicola]
MTTHTENINLESSHHSEPGDSSATSLRPTDKGLAPWLFVFASFVAEAILWGFPLSYGVFQDYYSNHPVLKHDSNIAVIGTVATGVYYLGGPLATPIVARYQAWQRHMIIIGWIGCALSLVIASFATSVPGLIATQGFLYGASFLFVNYPLLRMLNEWFVVRRGLAYGIMSTGAGCSGVAFPFLLESLLSKHGYRITLQVMAVAQFITLLPMIPLLKGRLPASGRGVLQKGDFDFFKQPLFYCFAAANFLEAMGYYIPSLFLPTYATALGLSGTAGALVLALNNLATIFSQLAFGYITDRVNNVFMLVFVSSFIASVATFAIWGFATSLAPLLAFSLLFGLATGGFPCLWNRFGSVLSRDPGHIYSLMAFGKGVGNILSGPISTTLVRGSFEAGYGQGRFAPLILYTGSMMLGSSLGVLGFPLMRKANKP